MFVLRLVTVDISVFRPHPPRGCLLFKNVAVLLYPRVNISVCIPVYVVILRILIR